MASRTPIWLAISLALAGCSTIGPFRANGTDDGTADASTSDGEHADSHTTTDGDPPGAQPRALTTSTHAPDALAASGGIVYFSELGTAPYSVARVHAAGGAVDRIDLGTAVPLGVAARGDVVAYVAGNSVVRANSAFTVGTPLVTSTQLTGMLAVSDSDVYYARSPSGLNNDRVERVSVDGGAAEPLYTTLESPPGLAATSTDLYWTTYASGYEVRKSSLATPGTFTTVENAAAGQLSAYGSTVCWIEQPDINQYLYDVRCNRQGTTSRIAHDYSQIFDVLVTASDVFIAVRAAGNVGEIERYHLSTQARETYVTLESGDVATALASDGTDLFWIASHTAPEGSATVYALAL